MRFRRSRAFADCQLHAVEFTTRQGRARHLLVRTWQEPGGTWVADPIGGSGGPDPVRPAPRLIFADGTVLADEARDGVVLFFSPAGVTFPATVQIMSAAGEILADYREFSDF